MIELFWENQLIRNTNQSILGVTGTNGKSTITLMIQDFKNSTTRKLWNTILDNLDERLNTLL